MSDNTFPAMLRRAAARFAPATIIDCGASDGRWSRMVRGIWQEAKLLLFEPNPIFKAPLDEMEKSGAHVARALVGAQVCGEKTLRMNFDKPYQGVYELDDDAHAAGASELVTVSVATIDHEVAWRGLPGPYLLKFDIHGREHDALSGARATLKSTAGIIIEIYTWSQGANSLRAADLIPHIEREHGFMPTDLCEPLRRPLDGRMVQCDMLFEPATAPNMNVPNMW